MIIANHPTGTLDGLALMYAVSRVRRDVKVVTNRMLSHLEPLSSLFIPVDNMGGGRTRKASLQQMETQLQNGGVLIFFPAGEVSRLTRKGIRDGKWHPGFIKLAAKFRTPLLPVWINARNSPSFMAAPCFPIRCQCCSLCSRCSVAVVPNCPSPSVSVFPGIAGIRPRWLHAIWRINAVNTCDA